MVERQARDQKVQGSNLDPGLKSKTVISKGINYQSVFTYHFDLKNIKINKDEINSLLNW